jgi:hypothetical protein
MGLHRAVRLWPIDPLEREAVQVHGGIIFSRDHQAHVRGGRRPLMYRGRRLPMRRQLLAAILLVSIGLQPAAAARRRGAKLYPNKETAADMKDVTRVFIGWIDFREDDWAVHGYSDKSEWAAAVIALNRKLLTLCQAKYLSGRTVDGAKGKGDENAAGYDLYIKFSDVLIDYSRYHLNLSIHFIDPRTNTEVGVIPARPYFGNNWGFVNYQMAALEEVGQKIAVEVTGETRKSKGKSPASGR